MDQVDTLITLRDFCLRVRISRPTAYSWKNKQFGPTMVRVGSRQFYRSNDVAAFIAGLTSGAAERVVSRSRQSRNAPRARGLCA
jgi:predicted DNA-binding transcriptional regulator AlpA